MNSGVEFSRAEWVQMALLLIAMPLAALMGAMLGLVGKWRQGRVVTAALVGICSAALVSAVLFLTFFVIYFQRVPSQKSFMLEFFDTYMGPTSALLASCITGVISLLAAIGLRGRKNEKSGAAAFSMRQLLLLQLFAFVAFGCWTGMRSFALRSGTEIERIQRIWSRREWEVQGNELEGPSYWERIFDRGTAPDMALENKYLGEALRVPSLRGLQLFNIPFADELAIEELGHAKELQTLYLSYASDDIDRRQVEAIGKAKAVRVLSLRTPKKLATDIKPIAALPQLDVLLLNDCTILPSTLDQLAESKSLRRLFIYYATNPQPKVVTRWPKGLVEVHVRSNGPMGRWSFEKIDELKSLKTLTIGIYGGGTKLTAAEVESIARCETLEFLTLEEAIADEDLLKLESLNHVQVLTIKEATAKRNQSFREKLQRLAMLPKLVNLNCDHQIIIEDVEWANQKPMPPLEEMDARREAWVKGVNESRVAAGLPPIRVTFSINAGPGLILGGSGGGSAAVGSDESEK